MSAFQKTEWRGQLTEPNVLGDIWPGRDADTKAGTRGFQREIEMLILHACTIADRHI